MSNTTSVTSSASAASSSAAGLVDTHSNPSFKIVGICLAVGSGFFIGTSFVVKKKGLLRATAKYGNGAGEGHGYLKSVLWWTGMIMMIVGEILNFVAYAFTEAILVTPMGALSVVICAILSHFFLRETLTFFGWIGCTLCIIGATILALNAPEQQSVTTIEGFKHLFLSVGFLVWAGVLIATSLVLVFYAAPRWGKKTMIIYIAICSLIGGISVSCTQGLGASIVTSIQGDNQVKNWFFWFLFVFVVITLLTEINYLNKALELFNTSMVVPVYFCFFSSSSLITSFILFQGLKASAITLITMVLGFLVTCLGITLLQLSKVDPKQLSKLDRRSTMLLAAARHPTEENEKGEVTALEDPGMDALRGGFGAVGSIIRARTASRRFSNASSLGTGWGSQPNNLSTHGMGNVQRFQLSDNPMPEDAMDQISLHSKSPTGTAGSGFGFRGYTMSSDSPRRSKSHIKFEDPNVKHDFPRHDSIIEIPSAQSEVPTLILPSRSQRQHPVSPMEDIAEDENEKSSRPPSRLLSPAPASAPPGQTRYIDAHEFQNPPYEPQSANLGLHQLPRSTSRGLSGLFSFGSGPDLVLGKKKSSSDVSSQGEVRGGSHRGTRDYPHLPKEDREKEHDERLALVSPDMDDFEHDSEEERGSMDLGERAVVVQARRLPEVPRRPKDEE
ncbi:hypothetical protein M231_01872 [Tremella mesenterica]|uniref:Magnesium transporter NIPA2 n=1 Tax=Tremella mesenterica TaxID=5217 RepID=A0A4Q1BS40_TREME|nr:hypothetical protein M231_01872 [Tremella mesenterica]